MDSRTDIWKELSEISPFLAGADRPEAGFEVPPGYFEEFASKLLNRIKASAVGVEPDTESLLLSGIGKDIPFSVPENYFEQFANETMDRIRAGQAGSVDEELTMLSPLLSGLDKKTPFTTPPHYFTEFSENMIEGLQALVLVKDELEPEHLSPLLESLKYKNSYVVPQGYFDTLPDHILRAAKQQKQQAPVITMVNKRGWMRYAAAAVVIGMIVMGGYLMFNIPATSPGHDPANPGLTKVSDQEILNFLDTLNVPLSDNNTIATLEPGETDANDLLNNVTDEELQKYLEEEVSKKETMTN